MSTDKTWTDIGINEGTFSGHGTQVKAICPVCPPHENPSHNGNKDLSVNLVDGLWKCHRCDWSGSLQTQSSGYGLPPLELTRKTNTETYELPQDSIYTTLPPHAIEWFHTRGISQETLSRAGIGFTQKYSAQAGKKLDVIQFPFYRDGRLLNIKYRSLDKRFSLSPGCERLFYGLDQIKGKEVYIVEGEIDALSFNEAGIDSVISVPDGAPAPDAKNIENKFRFIDSDIERFRDIERIFIAVDGDPPGRVLAQELSRRLGPEKCLEVSWPIPCKDANDTLLNFGKEVIKECCEYAKPWPIDGLVSVFELRNRIRDIYDNGLEGGESTGWAELDALYTVKRGEVTVVTGIPSSGKSLFISALTVNLARQLGWRFTMFSPEHSSDRQTITLMQQYINKPFRQRLNGRMTPGDVESSLSWVDHHYGFIKIDDDSPSIDRIIELSRIEVSRRGISGIVIDPWNEIDHSRSKTKSEQDYISYVLSSIRRFAEKYDVAIWIIAHPTKMQKQTKGDYQGKYPPPTPYDIASSSHFRNKPSNCITVWRDSDIDSEFVEVHIQKIKFPEVGKNGKMMLMLDKVTGNFTDIKINDFNDQDNYTEPEPIESDIRHNPETNGIMYDSN